MTDVLESEGDVDIRGYCDPRFALVLDRFKDNFGQRNELGSTVCVFCDNELVVDLWGGFTTEERTVPWSEDTLVHVYSATKGALAFLAHRLVSQGKLDLDAPVGDYWPEFACNGKESARVSMALDHSVGVPVLRTKHGDALGVDWERAAAAVAQEEAFWKPGTRHGYHGVTIAWTVGEILQRASGKSFADLYDEELREPLDLDFWIGMPDSEFHRAAISYLPEPDDTHHDHPFYRGAAESGSIQNRFFALDELFPEFNTPECYRSVVPSVSGMSNAKGLAKLYQPLANGGSLNGREYVDEKTLGRMGRVSMSSYEDATFLTPFRWALGFMKSVDNRNLVRGPVTASVIMGDAAFGHAGGGGQLGFADPEAKLSFGFTTNKGSAGTCIDERAQCLVDAAYSALGYSSNESGVWAK